MTGAYRVMFAWISALMVIVSTMLRLACPQASTVVSLPCVVAAAHAAAASQAFPLTILQCRGGLSRIAIDEHGVMEFERSATRGDRLYAKVSAAELAELRALIESDAYRRVIANSENQRGFPVCGASPFVRIEHYGRIADFEVRNGLLSPVPIAKLVGLVQKIQGERFPDEHSGGP